MRPSKLIGLLATTSLIAAACGQSVEAPAEQAAPQEDAKPLVLVAGATGGTGSLVVAELKKQGYPVRAFVRDAARAAERLGADVEAVAGDLKDAASIAAALDGVGARNQRGRRKRGAEAPKRTCRQCRLRGRAHLAEAAAGGGVGQYVLVSSRGLPTTSLSEPHAKHPESGTRARSGGGHWSA